MATYDRRARQARAQRDLATGRDIDSDGTIRSDMLVQKSPRVARTNNEWGKQSINDKGRPTSMAKNYKGQSVPHNGNPNLRRESIEIKKASARGKKK